MSIQPPLSRDELLMAMGKAFRLPENETQLYPRPRASSLASCARQQAYMMAGTEPDVIGTEGSMLAYDGDLTAEQGRMFEDLMVKTIEHLGVKVEGRQKQLPLTYPVSGHPDGELVVPAYRDHRIQNSLFEPEDELELGGSSTRWGVEFKHLGRWGFTQTLKKGLRAAHPNYILQAGLYGDALGWDAVMFIVSSQDASSIRSDATASLRYKTPEARWAERIDWHPKLIVETMEIREVSGLLPIAHARARWLSAWYQNDRVPKYVAREYDPDLGTFPCTYCPFLASCRADGDGGSKAPELPFRMG